MFLLPLVLVSAENQTVNCRVASVQCWCNEKKKQKKTNKCFTIGVIKPLNKVTAGCYSICSQVIDYFMMGSKTERK